MSVSVPIKYDFASEMDKYRNGTIFEDFGLPLYPHEILETPSLPTNLFKSRLLQQPFGQLSQLAALVDKQKMKIDKDGFQVSVDVKQFKPDELTVKTTDNYIVVEGNHEEREDDHGFIQRHFVRKYMLPNTYNPDDITSTISSDGVLTLKATAPQKSKEHVVEIQQTGTKHSAIKNSS